MAIFSHVIFSPFHILLLLLLLCKFHINNTYAQVSNQTQIAVPVRVVVDMNSSFGTMVSLCMDMAFSDFYASHSDYETRLQLVKKDAKSSLDLNLAGIKFF